MKHLKLDQIATILVTAITKHIFPATSKQTIKININEVREQANRKLGKIATQSLVNRISRLMPDFAVYMDLQLGVLVVSTTGINVDVAPYFIDFKLEVEEDDKIEAGDVEISVDVATELGGEQEVKRMLEEVSNMESFKVIS